MADAIDSGVCDLIGLGRTAVLEPEIPRTILMNEDVDDDHALAVPHIVRGQWFANMIPVKVVGAGLAIEFFYYNMRRLGNGLGSDKDVSIPKIVLDNILYAIQNKLVQFWASIKPSLAFLSGEKKIE
jgi:hypothetical protein